MIDFDTFTKIPKECGRFGQIYCCQRLYKVAQSPINCPIWSLGSLDTLKLKNDVESSSLLQTLESERPPMKGSSGNKMIVLFFIDPLKHCFMNNSLKLFVDNKNMKMLKFKSKYFKNCTFKKNESMTTFVHLTSSAPLNQSFFSSPSPC